MENIELSLANIELTEHLGWLYIIVLRLSELQTDSKLPRESVQEQVQVVLDAFVHLDSWIAKPDTIAVLKEKKCKNKVHECNKVLNSMLTDGSYQVARLSLKFAYFVLIMYKTICKYAEKFGKDAVQTNMQLYNAVVAVNESSIKIASKPFLDMLAAMRGQHCIECE